MNEGNDKVLLVIAVVAFIFSITINLGLSVMWAGQGDYSYDEINSYRNDLIEFSGEGMINQSPWVLKHVYTPWIPNSGDDLADHIDPDGWLFGEEITDYADLNKSADIHLDPSQKSSVPISVREETVTYTYQTGLEWWADNPISFITRPVGEFFGNDPYQYEDRDLNVWNYNGYRYVWDATLPFADTETASSKDGALSIVWYSYNNQEGLAGGLQIYGGDVILASYSAADIVADYNITNAYATTYKFVFQGVTLTLSIRFDPDIIENGTPLLSAWTQGNWSMAISSVSAGNFYDIENSASFANNAGTTIDTFRQIFTFDMPNVHSEWAKVIIWGLVGLPMTIAMLCIALRLLSAVRLFG